MHTVYRLSVASITLWPMAALSQEMVVVRPKEIDDVLINPGLGFMTFHRLKKTLVVVIDNL